MQNKINMPFGFESLEVKNKVIALYNKIDSKIYLKNMSIEESEDLLEYFSDKDYTIGVDVVSEDEFNSIFKNLLH